MADHPMAEYIAHARRFPEVITTPEGNASRRQRILNEVFGISLTGYEREIIRSYVVVQPDTSEGLLSVVYSTARSLKYIFKSDREPTESEIMELNEPLFAKKHQVLLYNMIAAFFITGNYNDGCWLARVSLNEDTRLKTREMLNERFYPAIGSNLIINQPDIRARIDGNDPSAWCRNHIESFCTTFYRPSEVRNLEDFTLTAYDLRSKEFRAVMARAGYRGTDYELERGLNQAAIINRLIEGRDPIEMWHALDRLAHSNEAVASRRSNSLMRYAPELARFAILDFLAWYLTESRHAFATQDNLLPDRFEQFTPAAVAASEGQGKKVPRYYTLVLKSRLHPGKTEDNVLRFRRPGLKRFRLNEKSWKRLTEGFLYAYAMLGDEIELSDIVKAKKDDPEDSIFQQTVPGGSFYFGHAETPVRLKYARDKKTPEQMGPVFKRINELYKQMGSKIRYDPKLEANCVHRIEATTRVSDMEMGSVGVVGGSLEERRRIHEHLLGPDYEAWIENSNLPFIRWGIPPSFPRIANWWRPPSFFHLRYGSMEDYLHMLDKEIAQQARTLMVPVHAENRMARYSAENRDDEPAIHGEIAEILDIASDYLAVRALEQIIHSNWRKHVKRIYRGFTPMEEGR